MWASVKMPAMTLYSSSNRIIMNVVLHDPDLNFQGKKRTANISKMVRTSAKISNVFCTFWYFPSNGTIADAVLHRLDLHFQGQTFWYAFAKKIVQKHRISVIDLPRLARLPPWIYFCFAANNTTKNFPQTVYVNVSLFVVRLFDPTSPLTEKKFYQQKQVYTSQISGKSTK